MYLIVHECHTIPGAETAKVRYLQDKLKLAIRYHPIMTMLPFSRAIAALAMLVALMLAATLVATRENTSKDLVVTQDSQDSAIQLRVSLVFSSGPMSRQGSKLILYLSLNP